MNNIRIRKGLNLPLPNGPAQVIQDSPNSVTTFGLIGDDSPGLRPTMAVSVGDTVKIGQTLYTDKKTEGVHYTSPVCGIIKDIRRGEKKKI